MLDYVSCHNGTDRGFLEIVETFRNPADLGLQSTLPEIRDGSLIGVESPGLDAAFPAELQKLAASAPHIDQRGGSLRVAQVVTQIFADFPGRATHSIFE